MATGGLIISTVGGLVFHKVSGTLLMNISCLGYVGSGILFAVMPRGANYWAYVFPAMICATLGIDISFNLTNIFITTNMPKARQGLAGALINCTLHMGIAVMLSFADIVQIQVQKSYHLNLRQSYQAAFWFQAGLGCLGLICFVLFVRIHHAKSDITMDERQDLEAEKEEYARQQRCVASHEEVDQDEEVEEGGPTV